MKNNIILLFLSISFHVKAEYPIIGSFKCTDLSKVNNRGSIQVKVLGDYYEGDDPEQRGLTLMIESGYAVFFEKTKLSSNEVVNKGKDKTIIMKAWGRVSNYEAKVIISATKGNHPKAKVIKISQSSDYSDLGSPPKNYNPTFKCK